MLTPPSFLAILLAGFLLVIGLAVGLVSALVVVLVVDLVAGFSVVDFERLPLPLATGLFSIMLTVALVLDIPD